MKGNRIFIMAMGIISAAGRGVSETIEAMGRDASGIRPLQLFSPSVMLPAGEIELPEVSGNVPRTHSLALIAAREAMTRAVGAPDAVVVGVTTGGMTLTEELLKRGEDDPAQYACHAAGSVARYIARHVGCTGPALTVTTACSSGAAALKIAMEMIRLRRAKSVLAGGADALCRFTYYGFHALQLVDATGAHPFDTGRRGMSVGEGAAMLLLTGADTPPENAVAELLGGGLSCDAYHPSTPHPEGAGALRAMKDALADARVDVSAIDYIHLHGTGTVDNDLAEAKAICTLFGNTPTPPLSSTKGAIGHSLGAAGAVGAVITSLSIAYGIIPANTGMNTPDPALHVVPVRVPTRKNVDTALVNSFGFGGNNAVIVVGSPRRERDGENLMRRGRPAVFEIIGSACFTGAGDMKRTVENIALGNEIRGIVPSSEILKPLDEKTLRRVKRLTRMAVSLAVSACGTMPKTSAPSSVFFGTGWGGLSETSDFLTKLFASAERFSSPTDFIGSVHNAAAGHLAVHFGATGPNVTLSGGDHSFEQALFAASLLAGENDDPILLIGADEYHQILSPRFDRSAALAGIAADGGGALLLKACAADNSAKIHLSFMAGAENNNKVIRALIDEIGGAHRVSDRFGTVLVGISAACRDEATMQLNEFLQTTGYDHPVIDYRRLVGEFASASAVAAVLAATFVKMDQIPAVAAHRNPLPLSGRGVLVLGLGDTVTALEILP